jgi:hypothetical protein
MEDPMLLEALLMNQRLDTEGDISTTQCIVCHLPPTEEIQSPMLLRSEAEQLVGHELIGALSDFKQLAVTLLSPQAQQLYSPVRNSKVEHLVSTQSFSRQRKTTINCRKPVVKVVRDLLTKKCVFVKRSNHMSAKSLYFGNLPLPP